MHSLTFVLLVAAKMRYEELKKQTQAELKATLDDLLEGEDTVCDISAKVWLENALF